MDDAPSAYSFLIEYDRASFEEEKMQEAVSVRVAACGDV